MKMCVNCVFISIGSPVATNKFAILPGSSEPTRSATPRIVAASSVMARSARLRSRPHATEIAASYGSSRLLAAPPVPNANVMPAWASSPAAL
jgi:hypothetical protein